MARLLGNLFGAKGPKALKDLKLQDIKAEQRMLEIQERKLETEKEEYEKQSNELFQKAIGRSESEKRTMALKVNNLRRRVMDINTDLDKIYLGQQAMYKLERVIERGRQIFKGPVWDKVFSRISETDLERWLVDKTMDEEAIIAKLEPLAKAGEISPTIRVEDRGVIDILDAMRAVEAGRLETDQAVKNVMKAEEKQKEEV